MPMQAERGGGSIAPSHSQAASRRRWMVGTTLRPLYPQERPGTGGWAGLGARLEGMGNLTPLGFDPPTVQPAANRYTD